jgi:photosystem II stability/assembly factor-like uncharacterized protein
MQIMQTFILLLLGAILLLGETGCEEMDRSKFKLPQINMVVQENLNAIATFPPDLIWIFGNFGTIVHSKNGGMTWEEQTSGTEKLLCDGNFVNENRGWAVGIRGTILSTADGGKTWKHRESGTEKNLFRVFFTSAKEGWIVGDYGTLLHTMDGGMHWEHSLPLVDKSYNGIFFSDPFHGWIVGEFGTILSTRDGGNSWHNQSCKDIIPVIKEDEWERPTPSLYDVYFTDKKRGWCVGVNGVVITTEDGGEHWKKVAAPTDEILYRVLIREDRGWIVGSRGVYLTSNDGGTNWSVIDDAIKTKFLLHDVEFCNPSLGVIAGLRGTIAITRNKGKDWRIVSGISYDMPEFGITDF